MWCPFTRGEPLGNVIVTTKHASGSAKIDPLMAAFNAIALMSTNPWLARPSIFVILKVWSALSRIT
jgi:phage terminase large subunit-like protein